MRSNDLLVRGDRLETVVGGLLVVVGSSLLVVRALGGGVGVRNADAAVDAKDTVLDMERGAASGLGSLVAKDSRLAAVLVPDEDSPEGNVDEAGDDEVERDTGAEVVGNRTLNGREDGTARHTHDDEGRAGTSVAAETRRAENEDGGVHDRLEEHDEHDASDTTHAVESADEDSNDGADAGVGKEEDGGGEDREERDTNETANGEEEEGVREELRAASVLDSCVLVGVVEEERANGDLGADVEELRNETGSGTDLLPEGPLGGGVLHLLKLHGSLESFLGNLGELGANKGDGNKGTHAGDGEVDPLDAGEVGRVFAREEVLGGDEGADERGDTVERLRELKTERGDLERGHDRDVRVGGDLKRRETTSNDGSADDEATEHTLLVGGSGRSLGNGPEENSTDRVEGETHQDTLLVTPAAEHETSDRREAEVTDTKVGNLKTSRLELGDAENVFWWR